MPDLHALQKLPYMNHSTKVAWLIKFLQKTLLENKLEKVVVVTQVSKRHWYLLYSLMLDFSSLVCRLTDGDIRYSQINQHST